MKYVKYWISLCSCLAHDFCFVEYIFAYRIYGRRGAASDWMEIPVTWCSCECAPITSYTDDQKACGKVRTTPLSNPSTGNRNIIKTRRDVTIFPLSGFALYNVQCTRHMVWFDLIIWLQLHIPTQILGEADNESVCICSLMSVYNNFTLLLHAVGTLDPQRRNMLLFRWHSCGIFFCIRPQTMNYFVYSFLHWFINARVHYVSSSIEV